ncbi:MAG: hypothetical protein AAFR18_16180 [Cyanobacteria bacterium J06627_32]
MILHKNRHEIFSEQLTSQQSPSGAFKSTICLDDQHYPDDNGFITAQVIRTLGAFPADKRSSERVQTAIHAGLTFLQQCESTVRPGAFGFWPSGQPHPKIAPLPEDADDTALIALELAKWGYLTRKALIEVACKVLLRYRLRGLSAPSPPWIRSGTFLTWLSSAGRANVIDCCVNANVVALLAYAGLQHLPGYQEACEMIDAGIRWAGNDFKRARTLTPFYPYPVELIYAIQYAVSHGAKQLLPSLARLRSLTWASTQQPQVLTLNRPICSSAYGSTLWQSEVLQISRQQLSRYQQHQQYQ